ncbi:TetR/AcrR family transcriptional regulator [Sphingobacterium shayense]|uniref:TetR/AcrR family transcriptional regulator n=1 Tax=Sphingobacterium shayense TaxID=626343 RepID=UPI0015550C4A|nr:TetR/AcrR family transcriptional regulator [Sphingobacterium shayense]NQD70336.1 TetR/AcrR family transcriptional regulator [Sphingobacterium shayense]
MDSRKDQIIQASLRRFAHFGFNKTTMSEIALDLNITKANLYYYYPDKNALIKDVLLLIHQKFVVQQSEVISDYNGNLLDILDRLVELRADFLREYYILHINENLEWIKGDGVGTILQQLHDGNVKTTTDLFAQAVDNGELALDNIKEYANCFVEIVTGLSLIRSIGDVLSGIPNSINVDSILASQKLAIRFIFSNKLISKNS